MNVRLRYTATFPSSVDGSFEETLFPEGIMATALDGIHAEAMRLRRSLDSANYTVSDGVFSIVIDGNTKLGDYVSVGHHRNFLLSDAEADRNFLPSATKELVEEFIAEHGSA